MRGPRETPLLFVQYQRYLGDGRVVVCGPSYSKSFLKWKSAGYEISVIDPNHVHEIVDSRVDFSNPHALASDELLGFDPVVDPHPHLRRVQNYGSVVFAVDGTPDLIHHLVLPRFLRGTAFRVTARLVRCPTLDLASRFLEEIQGCDEGEHLIWRYAGDTTGYAVVPLHMLSSSGESLSAVIIADNGTPENGAQIEVTGFLPVTRDKPEEVSIGSLQLGNISPGHKELCRG